VYGRTGTLIAQAGKRQELTKILMRAAELVGELPGCHLYLVTEDLADDTTIWVMEVWADKETHAASLQDERVRALIQEAMPLLGGSPTGTEMLVIGGHGL